VQSRPISIPFYAPISAISRPIFMRFSRFERKFNSFDSVPRIDSILLANRFQSIRMANRSSLQNSQQIFKEPSAVIGLHRQETPTRGRQNSQWIFKDRSVGRLFIFWSDLHAVSLSSEEASLLEYHRLISDYLAWSSLLLIFIRRNIKVHQSIFTAVVIWLLKNSMRNVWNVASFNLA